MNNSYCTVIDSNFVVGAMILRESIARSEFKNPIREPDTPATVPGYCMEDADIHPNSLRKSRDESIPFTVIVDQNFSSMDRGFLNFYGIDNIISMPDIKNPYTESGSRVHSAKDIKIRFNNAFNKLHIWSLDQFDKLIYLDSDILTVRPIHQLFKVDLGMGEVGMAPDLGYNGKIGLTKWNSGVMVVRPEVALHKKLLDNTLKYPSLDGSDQGYLVSFFNQSKGIKQIDQNFNFLKRRSNEWAAVGREVCNIHYVGKNKPWFDVHRAKKHRRDEILGEELHHQHLYSTYLTAYSSFVTDRWDEILGVELHHLNNLNQKSRESSKAVEGGLMYKQNAKIKDIDRLNPFFETKRYKLYHLAGLPSVKTVLEIGINEGHGALIMFKANPKLKYYGFDIGEHEYVEPSVEYLKSLGYNITYIKGNSLVTVPNYAEGVYEDSPMKFDLMHIDGCHEPGAAKRDILNCRRLAHEDTIIVFDDINVAGRIGKPLADMWAGLIKEGIIEEIDDFNMAPQSWDSRIGKYCF